MLSHCHSEISWHVTVHDLAFDGAVGSWGRYVVLMSTSGTRHLLSSVPDPDMALLPRYLSWAETTSRVECWLRGGATGITVAKKGG